jgi:hypothetical protein
MVSGREGEKSMMHVVSLGAGVQSTTMVLMAARGLITPMPDHAIFADTGAEPEEVYRHLDWLWKELPFPVHRVSAGNLTRQIMGAMRGTNRMDARPPFFTKSGGMLRRQCTQDFKILPIERKVRELIGLQPRQHWPKTPRVVQWIGISLDEAIRRRESERAAVVNRWPLLEMKMTRRDCLAWCLEAGYPRPPKSACSFCPFRSDFGWRQLKENSPSAFDEAVMVDRAIRPGMLGPRRPKGEQWFVHSDRVPLEEIDFSQAREPTERAIQFDMFGNECTGMCGV